MNEAQTIHERMVAILAELPPIGKDQKNVQQNFMFRGHDDVLNALNPLLAKHGVFALPTVLARETSERRTAKGSVMFEVSLLVEYTFYGAAGDSVRASAWGEGTDMGDKATSKAMTMAFKSVLNQAFAISNKETADPDAHTAEESAAHAASNGSSSTGAAPGRQAAAVSPPGPAAADSLTYDTGAVRSDAQAKLLHGLYTRLNAAGAITEEAFVNAAKQAGGQGESAQAVCETVTKAGASALISKLKTLETNVKAAA